MPRHNDQVAMIGTPYAAVPGSAELLYESGNISLFAGETAEDVVANQVGEESSPRNSLFLRRRTKEGKTEWRLFLTSGSDWKDADCMSEFGRIWVDDIRKCYKVVRASLSKDGRYVCEPVGTVPAGI